MVLFHLEKLRGFVRLDFSSEGQVELVVSHYSIYSSVLNKKVVVSPITVSVHQCSTNKFMLFCAWDSANRISTQTSCTMVAICQHRFHGCFSALSTTSKCFFFFFFFNLFEGFLF
jgi:hypothetical protein